MSECFGSLLRQISDLDEGRSIRKAELLARFDSFSSEEFKAFLTNVTECKKAISKNLDQSNNLVEICCLIGLLEVEEVIAEYGLKLLVASND